MLCFDWTQVEKATLRIALSTRPTLRTNAFAFADRHFIEKRKQYGSCASKKRINSKTTTSVWGQVGSVARLERRTILASIMT